MIRVTNPISCEWNLTLKCNLMCKFCSLSCSPKKCFDNKMTYNSINYIIRELKTNGIIYVSLSGGEPLISPYISYVINRLYEENFIITLTTNGILIDSEFIMNYKKKIKWIQLSLQSLDNGYNFEKMGVVSNKILQKFDLLRNNDINFSVATIDFKEKEQKLNELIEYYDKNFIKYYIRELIRKKKFSILKNSIGEKKCNLVYFSILPNGDVVQCAELGIVAGNILEEKLEEILKSDKLYICNPNEGCLLIRR